MRLLEEDSECLLIERVPRKKDFFEAQSVDHKYPPSLISNEKTQKDERGQAQDEEQYRATHDAKLKKRARQHHALECWSLREQQP